MRKNCALNFDREKLKQYKVKTINIYLNVNSQSVFIRRYLTTYHTSILGTASVNFGMGQ